MMIYSRFPNAQNHSTNSLPQLYSGAPISLQPFGYSGGHINYRDSSWLKLSVCELFLKNECPNLENCSLAHPPSNIKIDNTKVTVCYDFIKKRDCKHESCKYYHPHDALASAILRRGDDTKKNVNPLSHLGLTLGLRSPLQIPRSQDFLNLHTQNLLSSHMNGTIVGEPQLQTRVESSTTEVKKLKSEETDFQGLPSHNLDPHYYTPVTVATGSLEPSAHMNLSSSFNILQPNPMQASSLTGYHQWNPINMNNLLLQSLLNNNQGVASGQTNLESLLAFSGQKLYAPMGTYPPINMAQMPLINSMYYQQLLQNSLVGGAPQILYPGSINLGDLQQRTIEETSVAFINDKGTILETLPVCKDFLQGKCKRNQSCNYVHLMDPNVEIKDCKLTVCKNALKGQCHRPVCKFYHIPPYQLQKLGLHTLAQ